MFANFIFRSMTWAIRSQHLPFWIYANVRCVYHFHCEKILQNIWNSFVFVLISIVSVAVRQYFGNSWTSTDHNWLIRSSRLPRPHSNCTHSRHFNNWIFHSIFLIFSVCSILLDWNGNFNSELVVAYEKTFSFSAVIEDSRIQLTRQLNHHSNFIHHVKWPFTMARRYSCTVYQVCYIFSVFCRQCMCFG